MLEPSECDGLRKQMKPATEKVWHEKTGGPTLEPYENAHTQKARKQTYRGRTSRAVAKPEQVKPREAKGGIVNSIKC